MAKKVTKLVDLNLSELSLVTRGANQHANISIFKGEHVEFAKYLSTDDGAKSFADFMADTNSRERVDRISCDLWPIVSALRESLTSIMADVTISEEQKQEKIETSVAQFATTIQHPSENASVTNELLKLFEQQESNHMSEELVKKAEGLEAQVAELVKKLAESDIVAKMSDDEKKYLASLNDDAKADEFRAAASADRAKLMRKHNESDEVFKSAEGHEIRKSAVGEGVFSILKAQEDAIKATRAEMVKAAAHAQTVEFTKTAETDYANLPGETVAKVAVLKGMHQMDDVAKAALEQMLKAGNAALAKGFQSFGVQGGKPSDIAKSTKLAMEIKKRMDADVNLTKAQAEVNTLSAHPELYEG
jgi:hypothetical protein